MRTARPTASWCGCSKNRSRTKGIAAAKVAGGFMTKSLAPFGIVFALLMDVAHSQDNEGGTVVSHCRDRIRSIQLQDLVSQRSSPGAYIHLSNDQTILCFDGPIHRNQEMTFFRNLKVNGSFVMRSPGGYAEAAMEMANILLEKNAVVVLYDYCLSA